MRVFMICAAAVMALSGCVVQTVPGTSPTGPIPTGFPQAPSLASELGGRVFSDIQNPGRILNLFSDGSYALQQFGTQTGGTWRTVEATSQMCFTGPVAAYAGGACVPIRWDGDALTLFNFNQSVAMEAWIPF